MVTASKAGHRFRVSRPPGQPPHEERAEGRWRHAKPISPEASVAHTGVCRLPARPPLATSQLLCPNRADPAAGQSSNLGETTSPHGRPDLCCVRDRLFPHRPRRTEHGPGPVGPVWEGGKGPPSYPSSLLHPGPYSRPGPLTGGADLLPSSRPFSRQPLLPLDPAQRAAGPSPTHRTNRRFPGHRPLPSLCPGSPSLWLPTVQPQSYR